MNDNTGRSAVDLRRRDDFPKSGSVVVVVVVGLTSRDHRNNNKIVGIGPVFRAGGAQRPGPKVTHTRVCTLRPRTVGETTVYTQNVSIFSRFFSQSFFFFFFLLRRPTRDAFKRHTRASYLHTPRPVRAQYNISTTRPPRRRSTCARTQTTTAATVAAGVAGLRGYDTSIAHTTLFYYFYIIIRARTRVCETTSPIFSSRPAGFPPTSAPQRLFSARTPPPFLRLGRPGPERLSSSSSSDRARVQHTYHIVILFNTETVL